MFTWEQRLAWDGSVAVAWPLRRGLSGMGPSACWQRGVPHPTLRLVPRERRSGQHPGLNCRREKKGSCCWTHDRMGHYEWWLWLEEMAGIMMMGLWEWGMANAYSQ